MGDQIGLSLSGQLYYVPFREFGRILSSTASAQKKAELFSYLCRINILYMIACAGSGHIGSSFSSMEIVSWLYLNEIENIFAENSKKTANLFFSSKGHDSPAIYSTLIGLGKLDFDLLHKFRRKEGLPGHPDISTPNILTNTGSLGMGVSKAKGMLWGKRIKKEGGRVYVLTGDGELQEGQFWESLISAANYQMANLTLIIDHNKLQSDNFVSKVSDLGDLEAKLRAFGWHVCRCCGNNITEFSEALKACKKVNDRPQAIVADTLKGFGVSFMENTSFDSDVELYKFHSGSPSREVYSKALEELVSKAEKRSEELTGKKLELVEIDRKDAILSPVKREKLIDAYSEALMAAAKVNSNFVCLDADLLLDTGLIPFKKEFPDRFIECGIAEQDMVSQAGGMALQGLLPIVHSFSCFLSSRSNEQIYNNATERTKIIYVGSLAGLLPAGPGHSHQSAGDIAALGAIPGLTLVEPCCEKEVSMLLDWCVNCSAASSYLRLCSVPWPINFELPNDYKPSLGQGVEICPGSDGVLFSYGPIPLSIAVEVSNQLRKEGIGLKVINLPWLNRIGSDWFCDVVTDSKIIISLDNHALIGGQGDRIAGVVAEKGLAGDLFRFGVDGIPVCGTADEALDSHGLSVAHLSAEMKKIFSL